MVLLPIFCVARFSRTDRSMIVARALKIGKIADGGMPPAYETMHYAGRFGSSQEGQALEVWEK
jgi:hypothetical protein